MALSRVIDVKGSNEFITHPLWVQLVFCVRAKDPPSQCKPSLKQTEVGKGREDHEGPRLLNVPMSLGNSTRYNKN